MSESVVDIDTQSLIYMLMKGREQVAKGEVVSAKDAVNKIRNKGEDE